MIAALLVEAYILSCTNVDASVGLPVLAVSGVILLLGALSLVSIAFAVFGLNDKTQALGLPDGSIRAVIALSLVLLFGILAFFLYQNTASGHVGTVYEDIPTAQAQTLLLNAPPGTATDVPGSKSGTRTLYIHTTDTAANDLAKQILTVLGTLVTAIASFYFGASAVASATNPPGPTPAPSAVSPNSAAPGSSARLSISGSNLGSVDQARLTLGSAVIVGTNVLSNAAVVTADFAIPASATQGAWNVVVSAGSTDYTVPAQFTVAPPPAPGPQSALSTTG
jgi:hypothetical protein